MIPILPDASWWKEYGPLGIVALIVAAGIVTYLWAVHFPHAIATQRQARKHQEAKQGLEIEREQKLNAFIDRLSATHGEEVEHKRIMAATLDRMDKRQTLHSDACERTHKLTEDIARDLSELSRRAS